MTAQTPAQRNSDVPHDPSLPAKLQHVSASQIKTFRECNRKWFKQKIKQISVPETRAMTIGKDVHSALETWANTGLEPDLSTRIGAIAHSGLKHLPEWGNDLGAEVNIADPAQGPLLRCSGVPWVGYIDLVAPPRHDPERGALHVAPPIVIDHKTTKDLRYVKSEDTLRGDPQVVSYARWAAEKYWGTDWTNVRGTAERIVNVRFVYYLTQFPRGSSAQTYKGEKSARVDFHLSVDQMVDPWRGFERDVSEMLDLARRAERGEIDDADVQPNWSSCDAWGGCPHRESCNKLNMESLSKLRSSKEGTELRAPRSLSDLLTDPSPVAPHEVAQSGVLVTRDIAHVIIEQPGFDLYVDAVPVRGEVPATILEAYLAAITAQIVADWNDAHPNSTVQDVLEIEYGKWKGPLRALVTKNPPNGAVLARSFGELTQVALEALRPMARSVWQGVR